MVFTAQHATMSRVRGSGVPRFDWAVGRVISCSGRCDTVRVGVCSNV